MENGITYWVFDQEQSFSTSMTSSVNSSSVLGHKFCPVAFTLISTLGNSEVFAESPAYFLVIKCHCGCSP